MIFTKNIYTPPAILGHNSIMSLGASYKPGTLRRSTGHRESQKKY
jgi:hypothetical protein